MSHWYSADWTPPLPQKAQAWEPLWTFRHKHTTFAGELRFHGESVGWEARLLREGSLFFAHGRFLRRQEAVEWITAQRRDIENGWLDLTL